MKGTGSVKTPCPDCRSTGNSDAFEACALCMGTGFTLTAAERAFWTAFDAHMATLTDAQIDAALVELRALSREWTHRGRRRH